jgi:hypothetical protein
MGPCVIGELMIRSLSSYPERISSSFIVFSNVEPKQKRHRTPLPPTHQSSLRLSIPTTKPPRIALDLLHVISSQTPTLLPVHLARSERRRPPSGSPRSPKTRPLLRPPHRIQTGRPPYPTPSRRSLLTSATPPATLPLRSITSLRTIHLNRSSFRARRVQASSPILLCRLIISLSIGITNRSLLILSATLLLCPLRTFPPPHPARYRYQLLSPAALPSRMP